MDMESELTGKYQEKPNHIWLSKMVFLARISFLSSLLRHSKALTPAREECNKYDMGFSTC